MTDSDKTVEEKDKESQKATDWETESKEDLKSELERNKRSENEDPIRGEKKRKNNFIRNTYIHIGEIKNKKNRKERKIRI